MCVASETAYRTVGAAGRAVLNSGRQAALRTAKTRFASYAVDAGVSSIVETAGGLAVDTARGQQRSAGEYAQSLVVGFGTSFVGSIIGGEFGHA